VAGTYLLPTLSHTPLSATLLGMIPRFALISLAGSGSIRKGFGGCWEKNRACGRVQMKKDRERDCERSPRFCFFIRTPPQALFFSRHPPNPLRILPDPADVLPSQPFAVLPGQSILSAGCPTLRFDLSPSARHIPMPSEPSIAGGPAYPHPPHALRCLSCLQLPA